MRKFLVYLALALSCILPGIAAAQTAPPVWTTLDDGTRRGSVPSVNFCLNSAGTAWVGCNTVPTAAAGSPSPAVQTVQGIAGGTNLPTTTLNGLDIAEGNTADTTWTGTGACTVISCLKYIGTGPTAAGTNTIGRTLSGPDSATAAAIAPATVVNAGSQVAKASPGNLYSLNVDNAAVTGTFAVVYNATAAPAAGATLTTNLILWHFAIGSAASLDKSWPIPVRCSVGCVILYTTSLSTFTAPATVPVASTVMIQ